MNETILTAADRQEAIHGALADAAATEGVARQEAMLTAGVLTLDAEAYVDALAMLRGALEAGAHGATLLDALTHLHTGRVLGALGRGTEALTHFMLAGHTFRAADRVLELAACLREHGRVLADLLESDAFELLGHSADMLEGKGEPVAEAATHLGVAHAHFRGGLLEGARLHQRLAAERLADLGDSEGGLDVALMGFRIDAVLHPEVSDLEALDRLRNRYADAGRRQSAATCDLLIARSLAVHGEMTAALARALVGARIRLEQWIDISDPDEVGLWFHHYEADLEFPMTLAELVGAPALVVDLFEAAAGSSERGVAYPHEEQYLADLAERAGGATAAVDYGRDTLFGSVGGEVVPGEAR